MAMPSRVLCILSLVFLFAGPTNAVFPLFGNPFFFVPGNDGVTGRVNAQATSKNGQKGAAQTEPGKHRDGKEEVAETNWPGKFELFIQNSGVSAMHAILLPKINKVQIYDATIWRISEIKLRPGMPCHLVDPVTKQVDCWAHSVFIDVATGGLKPLTLETDTWCSSGGLSINGTLVGTGGFQGGANTVRYLGDCDECDWIEYPKGLAAPRWYSTQATLPDGSFIVAGGRAAQSYEYIPPEGVINTKLYDSLLLRQTTDIDENNLYPFLWLSTDGNLFMFANNRSILLSPKTNTVVREFPVLPGGARNYPGSGSSALLPIRLHVVNGPVIPADVLVCGGAPHDAFSVAGKKIFNSALLDCARMTITSAKPKWKTELMPSPRVMGDTVILPTGDILLVNGAKKGCAGWDFAKEPNFNPVLYMTRRRRGQRFRELAPSNIPRMYHSTATLLPDGKVLIAGSNTNNGYIYNSEYPTELRVEKFSPPYLDPALADLRPEIVAGANPQQIKYCQKFALQMRSKQAKVTREDLKVTMHAPAFTTHAISMNQRLLILGIIDVVNNVAPGVHNINVAAPPSGNIAPPGFYLIFVVYRGVPSVGEWIQIV